MSSGLSLLAIAAALLIAATGAIHSLLGERRLIGPLTASGAFGSARAARIMRFTWHLTTLLMLLTAATVAWPGTPLPLVLLIGAAYLGLGLLALYFGKGRHVAGPMFTAAGLLTLLAAYSWTGRP